MIRYRVEDIMREGPCSSYTRERVRALWGGSESLSHDDIARLPLPIGDRLWALWHLLFRLSPYRAFRVARLIALDILDLWDPPDIVVWFLCGGHVGPDDALASEAARAARAAAYSAGEVAARARTGAPYAAPRAAEVAAWAAEAAAEITVRGPWRGAAWAAEAVAGAAVRVAALVSARSPLGDVGTSGIGWSGGEAARDAAMTRYLTWVVKAFDPFTPVGGLL